jgi:hypothetical protein
MGRINVESTITSHSQYPSHFYFPFTMHSSHFVDMDERALDEGVRLFGHALVGFLEKGNAEV